VQVARGVVAGAWSGGETARFLDASAISFPTLLSLVSARVLQKGPERSRERRFGAAPRTLDGEDHSETVYDEGKEVLQLDSISEAHQAKPVACACGNHSSI
jgi:hypothetical protein